MSRSVLYPQDIGRPGKEGTPIIPIPPAVTAASVEPDSAGRIKFWRDADGKVVLGQIPNLPLIGWLVFAVRAWISGASHWRSAAGFISSAFLFTWAYLELTQGANYFRRLVGLVVLAAVVGSRLR